MCVSAYDFEQGVIHCYLRIGENCNQLCVFVSVYVCGRLFISWWGPTVPKKVEKKDTAAKLKETKIISFWLLNLRLG